MNKRFTSETMAEYSSQAKLSQTKFHNWIKSGLAILYTRDGVQQFVVDEISDFQRKTYDNVLQQLNKALDTECSSCTTDTIVCDKAYENCKRKRCASFHRQCPEGGLCDQLKEKIKKAHIYHRPSWINTDAQLWCSDPWQVAKCFMPREGYSSQMSAEETDFNGIVSVILNHENFSQKLSAKLTDRENIFRKAQNVSKLFRHSASFEVEDEDFQNILDTLTKVLQEKQIAQYPEAQDAMQKLSELHTTKWSIFTSKDDLFTVMKTACTSEKVVPETADGKEKLEMLQIAVKVIEENTNKDIKSVIWQMQVSFNTYQENIEQKRKRKDISRKLIKCYQLDCSTLPISALFEEEDAPLLSFYVQPLMQQVDYHNIRKHYTTVKSYNDIFHKEKDLRRNIYLTGNAGTGKTAFCQKMVLCWCHAKTGGIANDNFSQEDINAMKIFDFLFFISLRDTEMCQVNSIIQQQLFAVDKAAIIDQIIEDEQCLLILDGLDEWSHPKSSSSCPGNKIVPHRKSYGNCIYLTTSRPWKLEANRLSTREIDQHIELKGLDRNASDKLTSFIVDHLNVKYLMERNPRDFQAYIEKKKQVENVSEIPIIKIQLISLWFNNIDIITEYSRCMIYAETVEMLFSRAIEREEKIPAARRISEKVKQRDTAQSEHDTPTCILKSTLLSEFLNILYKVGRLAFDMLFNTPEGESALVFKRNIGQRYELSDVEMDFLLFVGILSKNKLIGPQTDRLIKLTFLHKSYQEYFAALYMTMSKEHESNRQRIFSKCKSLVEFLKYEHMLVFLSGMNVETIEKMSTEIRNMVSEDKDVKRYRQSAYYKFGFVVMLKPYNNLASESFEQESNGRGALRALQTLLLHCLEECDDARRTKGVDLPLSDVFIDEKYTSELKSLVTANRHFIRSVSTDMYSADFPEFDMLEKLVVNETTYSDSSIVDMKQYENCIRSSSLGLVSLSLANCKGRLGLSTYGFKTLTSLALYDIFLEHQEIDGVFNFISKTAALSQLFLYGICCSDHRDECSGGILDLSKHSELKCLRLQNLYEHGSHQTRLNTKSLQLLVFQGSTNGKAVKSIIEDLRNAKKLTEVVFLEFKTLHLIDSIIDILPTLQSLQRVSFYNVDFGDRILQLDTENKQPINMVSFVNASLTFQSFCRFVDSLPNTGVIVHIQAGKVIVTEGECRRETDMGDAAEYVRTKEAFEITYAEKCRLDFSSKC